MLDAIILIAALAGGFAATKWLFTDVDFSWSGLKEGWADGFRIRPVLEVGYLALPSLLELLLALIPIRLQRPRPRRWASQPGWIASLAVATVSGFVLLWGIALVGLADQETRWELVESPNTWISDPPWYLLIFVSIAISSSWKTLAASRRRCPERGWIDRTGRALGWMLVVGGIASIPLGSYVETREPLGFKARTVTPPSPSTPSPAGSPPSTNQVPPG